MAAAGDAPPLLLEAVNREAGLNTYEGPVVKMRRSHLFPQVFAGIICLKVFRGQELCTLPENFAFLLYPRLRSGHTCSISRKKWPNFPKLFTYQ